VFCPVRNELISPKMGLAASSPVTVRRLARFVVRLPGRGIFPYGLCVVAVCTVAAMLPVRAPMQAEHQDKEEPVENPGTVRLPEFRHHRFLLTGARFYAMLERHRAAF
jgi:hypothetical protein